MRVLVAGATGDIGRPSVRALLAAGHEVIGLTRSPAKVAALTEAGARAAVVDVHDATALREVVGASGADAVVQLLTALPRGGPTSLSDLTETSRLRRDVTPVLVHAARAAGIRRYVSESFVLGYGDSGAATLDESAPFAAPFDGPGADAAAALAAQERAVLAADGIMLRFGFFYGHDVGSTQATLAMLRTRALRLPRAGLGVVPWVHVEDAAAAVVAAVESDRPGSVYNIVGDEPASMRDYAEQLAAAAGLRPPGGVPWWLVRRLKPYLAVMLSLQLRLSNERAARDLGWRPGFPTIADGIRTAARA